MYAVIECGGKQYRVQEGDFLKVEKLPVAVGSNVTIDKVLLIGGEQTVIGNPFVEGAKVVASVLNQDKNKKILVFHYKAKKNIRVRYGHRQPFTGLLIQKIVKAGESADVAEQPVKAKKAAKTAKAEQAATSEVKATKSAKVETEAKPKATRAKKAAKTEA